MASLVARHISHRFYPTMWRASSTSTTKKPYWSSIFPDGQTRSFEEIPLIKKKNYDLRKYYEISQKWFQKYGYVAKELLSDNSYVVHLFHFDDFKSGYCFGDELYEDIIDVEQLQEFQKEVSVRITDGIIEPLHPLLEKVADDLVKILRSKILENNSVQILPLLNRWAFESTGAIALNKRLNSLSESGSEEVDKFIKAVLSTKSGIGVSTLGWCHPEIKLRQILEAQDFIYSVIIKYVDETALKGDSRGMIQDLLSDDDGRYNAIIVIVELFKGTLQTVPQIILMALYNLALNMELQIALRVKIVKLLPSVDTKYFTAIGGFNSGIPRYLSGIVWETLRLNPPIIGNGRVLQKDLILGGYQVPKGMNIILHHQVAFLMEKNFKEPLVFKPRRHPTRHQMHLEYAFGGNKFFCLGKHFVVGQITLVLAKILRNFQVTYDGGDVNLSNTLYNEPDQPLGLKLSTEAVEPQALWRFD